jgi:4-diphosphocytidyl-2-C-methyl-D-erythritol kinase
MAFDPLSRPVMTRTAPAKINLALSVGPPREGDGYHPIASWVARLDLADDLTLTRLDDGDLSRYAIVWHDEAPKKTPIEWSVTKDLAVRAHLLMQERVGRPLPVQMKLEKRIPVGGGLGGGSADAAAMLLAVADLFEIPLTNRDLADIALELGADVPFCLLDHPAVMEGVGDQITETPKLEGQVVLIVPPFGCDTGSVYRAFDESPGRLRVQEVHDLAHAAEMDGDGLFNDLAEPATRVAPALRSLIDALRPTVGAPIHVTGSGSTCFLVVEEGEDAQELAASVRRQVDDDVAVLPASLV